MLGKFLTKEIFYLLLFLSFLASGQEIKRSLKVKKIDQEIKLDGVLNELIWQEAEAADNFWQQFPTDSLKALDKTEGILKFFIFLIQTIILLNRNVLMY